MTRQPETITFWRGVLPHWEVVDGRYFVTVRLANSLPHRVVQELSGVLTDATDKDYLKKSRAYFKQMEQWLDKNTSETFLRQADVAAIVKSTIDKYVDVGYWHMIAAVTMPNHIHMFFRCGDRSLSHVMREFKRYTGRACNEILGREGKRFWQREWFDHWSRSADEDNRIVSYIRNNPVRSGLVKAGEEWPWIM
ncbi:MAG: transposase [Verrucomicrobiota bacterium]